MSRVERVSPRRRRGARALPKATAGSSADLGIDLRGRRRHGSLRHGYRRFTLRTSICLATRGGLKREIHRQLEGLRYAPPSSGKACETPRMTSREIVFLVVATGDFSGDGNPKPVALPNPGPRDSSERTRRHPLRPPGQILIERPGGFSERHRTRLDRDLADVLGLIKRSSCRPSLPDRAAAIRSSNRRFARSSAVENPSAGRYIASRRRIGRAGYDAADRSPGSLADLADADPLVQSAFLGRGRSTLVRSSPAYMLACSPFAMPSGSKKHDAVRRRRIPDAEPHAARLLDDLAEQDDIVHVVCRRTCLQIELLASSFRSQWRTIRLLPRESRPTHRSPARFG